LAGLLREEVGSTFSDLWYRVAKMRPRLSPHAQVIRQTFGSEVAYIVEDPASGQYYRLSEAAYFFVGLLDGRRRVEEAWDSCCAQLGDAAPTQKECVDVLSRLQLYGLLVGELPLAADMVKLRKTQVRSARFQRRTGRWFYYTIPLFNPEPALGAIFWLLHWIFSWTGLAAWIAVVGFGTWMVLGRADELGGDLNHVMDPRNLVLLAVMFLLLRAWHELGHAAACKALGGRSTEIGVILMALILPVPYCDATSAWRFRETWKRVVVSAAGMLFEVFAAGIAGVVWARTAPGETAHALAYNAMLISGIATLVFNANPLLRYDGYYILADLAGTPNLSQRSRDLWRFLLERVGFGIPGVPPPAVRGRGEAWFLGVYGALSLPYRMFITISVLTLIASRYMTLGAVLATVAGFMWLVWPTLKGLGYLAGAPRLIGRRARAVGLVSALALVLLVGLGLVPAPAAGYAPGTLEPEARASLRSWEPGFVRRVLVHVGDSVVAGQALIEMDNPETAADLGAAQAGVEQAEAELDEAMTKSPADRQVAEARLTKSQKERDRIAERAAALTIKSPIAGRVVASSGTGLDLDNLEGRYIDRGTALALVATTDRLVVRASVPDNEHGYIFRSRPGSAGEWPKASLRVHGQAWREVQAKIIREAAAGSHELATPSLTTQASGEVMMDPSDPQRRRTMTPQFMVEIAPSDTDPPPFALQAGQRVRVRFGVEPEPLAVQWWRWGRQYFSGKVGR
jgi:putative peptide zinc metalloprotease protein